MREIELKPSRWLGLMLVGLAVLAWVAIYLAALPVGLQLALGLAVAGWSAWGWRQAAPRASLRLATDGQLQILDDSPAWCNAEIQGDSFVSAALIVLRYRAPGGPLQTLVLLPDSADADDLRRLRVLLRWTRRTRSDTSFPGAG